MFSDNEVYDEIEIASMNEFRATEESLKKVLKDIPPKRDIESLIDPELECDVCAALIPIERQRVVLQIAKTCDHCVDCQQIIDKQHAKYAYL